jgi:hypothetical protein
MSYNSMSDFNFTMAAIYTLVSRVTLQSYTSFIVPLITTPESAEKPD